MPLQPGSAAPYTTASAALTALDAWRDRGMGLPITPETLTRAGVPESLARRTFQSLVALELLDAQGNPSEQFNDFRATRGDDEYRTRLQEWLRAVYADVLQYADPSTDSHDRVTEAFRSYEPAGQRRAMASLLLGLWKYAGLPLPQGSAGNGAGGGARPVRAARTAAKKAPKQRKPEDRPRDSGLGLEGLPAGLVGLLHQIPRDGESWTSQRRDDFLRAFTAVLDFSVPQGEPDPDPYEFAEGDEEDEP